MAHPYDGLLPSNVQILDTCNSLERAQELHFITSWINYIIEVEKRLVVSKG